MARPRVSRSVLAIGREVGQEFVAANPETLFLSWCPPEMRANWEQNLEQNGTRKSVQIARERAHLP